MNICFFLNQVIIRFKKYSLEKMDFLNHNHVLQTQMEIDIFSKAAVKAALQSVFCSFFASTPFQILTLFQLCRDNFYHRNGNSSDKAKLE